MLPVGADGVDGGKNSSGSKGTCSDVDDGIRWWRFEAAGCPS